MKPLPYAMIPAVLVAGSLLLGCGKHQESEKHEHGETGKGEESGHGHDHDDESPSGASFKAGKGVIVAEETRKIIGLETMEVEASGLSNQVQLPIQVFGEKHHHALSQTDHSGCDVHGSGLLATNVASVVTTNLLVQITKGTNELNGVVLGVQKSIALGESEIIVGISNAATVLKPGEFVPARVSLPNSEALPVVPKTALLRTSEGTFVYTVNGDAYFRTAVKTGAETETKVAITDGLFAGDQVVSTSVETLWLIELRATKGGGHSH